MVDMSLKPRKPNHIHLLYMNKKGIDIYLIYMYEVDLALNNLQ